MYSLEQLKIFVEVCDSGSFSAAARRLKRAQSGVSQAVANLEITIDQPLFDREGNKPILTIQGQALLPVARAILQQKLYFDQKIEALTQAQEHDIVLAVDESLLSGDLIQLLAPLAEQFPSTHFELLSLPTFDVLHLLRNGEAQLGIVYARGELASDLDFILTGQARFLTVAHPQHPLTALDVVKDSDLKAYRQCVHRSAAKQELWFTHGISTSVWYADNHQVLVEMVKSGIGWANVPERLIQGAIAQSELVALPVAHERSGWLASVGCLVSRRHNRGPVLTAVVERLQQHQFVGDRWQ